MWLKTFDPTRWDCTARVIGALGFGQKMQQIIYWLFENIIALAFSCDYISKWHSQKLVHQGCLISALPYALVTPYL